MWEKVGQFVTDTGMRATNTAFRAASDASSNISVQFRLEAPSPGSAITAPDFEGLTNFISRRKNVTTLRVHLEVDESVMDDLVLDQLVDTFADILFKGVPNTTVMSLTHRRHYRMHNPPRPRHLLRILTPFASKLKSLEVYSPLTAQQLSPFHSLEQLHIPAQDMQIVSALPNLKQLTAKDLRSISAAAFSAARGLKGLSIKVLEPCDTDRNSEPMDGIQLLTNLTELQIYYSYDRRHSNDTLPVTPAHSAAFQRISQLQQLHSLCLTWDRSINPTDLSNMHRLVRLRIACPHITSLAFLSGMTSLRDLNLHVHKHRFLWETQQHPAIDLSHNQQLHTLVLHNRHMSYEVIEMIAALPALKALDLSGCTGLGGHRILPLAALTGLTSLRLEFTHVSFALCDKAVTFGLDQVYKISMTRRF